METVTIILEDESRPTRPDILMEAVETLGRLRSLGNHVLIQETETETTRIEVRTSAKKSFWKRLWGK